MPVEMATELAGVWGFRRHARELAIHGLRTVEDLLFRLPFRYEDRSRVTPIAELVAGVAALLRVEVVTARLKPTRRHRFSVIEADVRDDSGSVAVTFFNQGYLKDVLIPGVRLDLFGRPDRSGLFFELRNPEVERTGAPQGAAHCDRIIPIYERIGRLRPRTWRSYMHRLVTDLASVDEILPDDLVKAERLPSRDRALREVHFPTSVELEALNEGRTAAHRRLAFEELFIEQLGVARARVVSATESNAVVLAADDELRASLRGRLPFRLTAAQKRVLREVSRDLRATRPMRRLVQGDVGSGKTVVAALAMALAASCGHQAAMMVPTELLAEQHSRSLAKLLRPTGFDCALLTGGLARRDRRDVLARLADGTTPLVVGTHAIIQREVRFHSLALIIVDEQHRFGVSQREGLGEKGRDPHVLVMTATPIPRSLAMTVYGDLDLSVIDELPPGRQPIRTILRVADSEARTYSFVRSELEAGRQAYVVCPLVEESSRSDLKAAQDWAERVAELYFRGFQVGLVHGRQKPSERHELMKRFASGEIHVLVGTTVIEVGIDVANASTMVIEHAERFGLSQLHQLRGRIGRGEHPSSCFLMIRSQVKDVARERLEVMRRTTDGFAIAEADLKLRGPGELFGTRQSGMPSFRVANVLRDFRMLERARDLATGYAADRAWMSTSQACLLRTLFDDRHGPVRGG